jgi:hypothetical protein
MMSKTRALVWLFLVVLAVWALVGCGAPGYVRADAIDEVVYAVTARHDVYVQADPTLGPEDKATYLRSSEILRRIVTEALAGQEGEPDGR